MTCNEEAEFQIVDNCYVRMYGFSEALLMSSRTLSHDPHYHILDLVVQPQQPPHLAIVKPSDVGRSV